MFSEPKIAQLDGIVPIDKHVVRLDVAMHNAMVVEIRDDSDHLRGQPSPVLV
jgi:hypothetical protein